MAFSCRPELIVLDEPTTGLDVATQRHVLDTVRGLCSSYGVAALYVTHDLAVVAEIADRVAVMYAGQLIELGTTKEVFDYPGHPYTDGLLRAIPSPEICHVLEGMEGQPPSPGEGPPGCFVRAALRLRHRRVRGRRRRRWSALWRRRPQLALHPREGAGAGLHGRGEARRRPRVGRGQSRGGAPLLDVAGLDAFYNDVPVLFDVDADRAAHVVRGRGGRVRLGQDHARPLRRSACTATGPGRCVTTARSWAPSPRTATWRCCARCSTSSRTRTRR